MRMQRTELIFIPQTGHTYQRKQQEVAEMILKLVNEWRNENEKNDL